MTSTKDKIAQIIRILTAPPIWACCFIIIIRYTLPQIFADPAQYYLLQILLVLFPALSYPVCAIIPGLRKKGRDAQRHLAFIFTLISYTAAAVWACLAETSKELHLITLTYFVSVVLLTVFNKALNRKVSGHASSFTAPAILLAFLIDIRYLIPGFILAAVVWWASLQLKRHTSDQLLNRIKA